MNNYNRSRRRFIKKMCLTTAAATSSLNVFQQAIGSTAADDYKALVCIFLNGGNDSFNMFVPLDGAEYQSYQDSRTNLAIPRDSLLQVQPSNIAAANYGFHPAASAFKTLFDNEDLSILANVGALTTPVNLNNLDTVEKPPHIHSHLDQLNFWHSLDKTSQHLSGWGARALDKINTSIPPSNTVIPNAFTFSDSSLWLSSTERPFRLDSSGSVKLNGILENSQQGDSQAQKRTNAFLKLLEINNNHLFIDEFAKIQAKAQRRSWVMSRALDQADTNLDSINWPNHALAKDLNIIAKTISVRSQLGHKRDIFYIDAGGWDTHSNQLSRHALLLTQLSESMAAFNDAMKSMNIHDKVTTFTGSEFGRTLTSNGDGTDHGWGGHQLIMGGAVDGGKLFGAFPSLEIGGPDDYGRGRIIPTTSIDSYGATLAKWMGVNDDELHQIFPNLVNFNEKDIGFFSS
ncbi:uncharacterized protein (DUF1501 family) [Sinobacterium caligoides]|uniref:Uncharacterized protein (DUF1501 family) n=1 Tax=Sinobacterium caligoides TaxID=933926 RepID=A0A3N2DXM6_9GAMM|nr:DUF1501 domain-containing protein [Sinobacterium caligoides]ROS04583.1 uncharacterized protein (DUF1501 family) [Sinobacterium caligoides]